MQTCVHFVNQVICQAKETRFFSSTRLGIQSEDRFNVFTNITFVRCITSSLSVNHPHCEVYEIISDPKGTQNPLML